MTQEYKIPAFAKGIHNLFPDYLINSDALSDALGWITKDGEIQLARGRERVGADGGTGQCDEVHFGYKVDGTAVMFRKAGTKIQTLVGSTWTDVITGLTAGAPTSFSNYASLAGAFVYIFSTDGIYKICTANPTSYASLYDSAKNFKGIGFIDKGRTILWGREKDRTGLYGSWIDAQNTTTYTTVSGEAITDVASGTLAFKAGGATRTCFVVQITDTSSGEVFTDNYNGGLTGSLGSTGTINYMTGAFTITGQSGGGTATYQWENSNVKGVTDFTKSVPRVAAEGFIFRQDIGGDAIKSVHVLDGTYYSIKERSIYSLFIESNDTDATNEVFRNGVGVPSSGSSVPTSKGIILMDTSSGDQPLVKIISRNVAGDSFDVTPLFSHFDFSLFTYDEAKMFAYGDYILIACKSSGADKNDNILMCDFLNSTVDILPYEAMSFAQNAGILYSGDSVSANTYKTLNGFDDLGYVIENYADGKADDLTIPSLKKTKKLRLKGLISKAQAIEVYMSLDNGAFSLVGTIDGDSSCVDITNPNTVGSGMVGGDVVGGSDAVLAYPFYIEMKTRTSKYQRRKLRFKAIGLGFASIKEVTDYDIWSYDDRIPKRYRLKQNVDINDSSVTDLSEPNN